MNTSAENAAALLEDARTLQRDVADLRHRLHEEPEIGLDLPRTQQKVLDWLEPLGYEITLGTDTTSVTAVLRGGSGDGTGAAPAVLLRGDMDALPVQERTGLAYSSRVDGVMHACGHDLHTAMLAGAATLLAERREQLAGDVVLMFQPGEEGFDGASIMIREGILDAAGPRVCAAYGLHVASAMAPGGTVMGRPGPVMSASDGLVVTVRGAGGHGSAPFLARDPVPAAAEMVIALQALVTRQFDIFDPIVISVGLLQAGTKRNVIPDEARFEATIRSYSAANAEKLRIAIPRLLQGIAAAHGLEAEINYLDEYPVTVNDDAETAFFRHQAEALFGTTRYFDMPSPLAGSEDFSRILQEVPGSFHFLSAVPEGTNFATAPFNHSAEAVFGDQILADGTALYARLAIERLAKETS